VTLAPRGEVVPRDRGADVLPDRALAERVSDQRDGDAFRVLYARHTPALYAMAMRMTGQPADAEDAVHETWLRAVEALGRFQWRSSLRTWLVSIPLNRLREVERQDRHVLPLWEELAADAPPAELPRDVDPLDLEAAIHTLPPGYRRVLVLHDVEGFTHEDIAVLLGISPGTSKSQLSHARRRLRRALSAEDQVTP
jgi:RNA polymerase sigma-70 factor, ECF subfamily